MLEAPAELSVGALALYGSDSKLFLLSYDGKRHGSHFLPINVGFHLALQ